MAYILIESFASGVDRSRPIYALPSGTLWEAINCHLSRGGDVEKRKAFVPTYTMPATTFGLASSGALVTFGSDATAPGLHPAITYFRLQHPTGVAMARVLDWDLFNGLVYAIAQYADGSVHHFYNGARIPDWDGGGNFPLGKGTLAKTHKRKMYSPYGPSPAIGGSILGYSMLDDATQWDSVADDGAGFNNLSNHNSGSARITGLGVYQDKLAAFARRVVQIWTVHNDEDLNTPFQIIEETGTRAPKSVRQFGNLDLFYLSDTGIRSLRARDNTDAAGVQDVGTPIDTFVREVVMALTDAQVEAAAAIIDPVDGRFWLAIGGTILVFTYFPSKKVSAWSWYEPGFVVEDFCTVNDEIWARATNGMVYQYGGPTGETFDSCRVTVQLPFNTVRGKDGTYKQFEGMDIAAAGEWACTWLVDPNELNRKVQVGDLADVTYLAPLAAADGHYTHVAPRLVNEAAGYASLSNVSLYHEQADNRG